MKKLNLILLIQLSLLFFIENDFNVYCQPYYRVFFRDKGPIELKPNNEIYNQTLGSISKKSIERRSKVLADTINYEDIQVYQPYIDSLVLFHKLQVIHTLKWLNYVLVRADSEDINIISKYPFVQKINPAKSKFETSTILESNNIIQDNNYMTNDIINDDDVDDSLNYGGSYLQVSSMNVDLVHKLSIYGENALLGFLDSGFRWKKHKSLIKTNVVAEYDFIQKDYDTSNDSNDVAGQDSHGTLVLSVVSGNDKGKLLGVAPDIKVVLAKTENLASETSIEEDNFAKAIEWMDSIGVDIISASLGYRNYDSSFYSYIYDDLDGNTTLSSKYVNLAVQKGIVFFNAVGNNGKGIGTLNTPADANLVLSVGSVDSNLISVSDFSSRGPNFKGLIKPEFVAFGNRTVCANPYDSLNYTVAKGTSLSTPLLAGATGLVLSTFPELTPEGIKKILISSSDNKNTPNNDKGYGLPNIYNAMINYGIVISPINYYQSQNFIRVVVNIAYCSPVTYSTLFVQFNNRGNFEEYALRQGMTNNQYFCDISIDKFNKSIANAYIVANSNYTTRRYPYYENTTISINPLVDKLNNNIDMSKLPSIFVKESKSFVYPTIVHNNTQANINVNLFNVNKKTYLVLFDSYGGIIESKSVNELNENISKINFNVSNLSVGAYFVGIFSGKNKEILKFLVIE